MLFTNGGGDSGVGGSSGGASNARVAGAWAPLALHPVSLVPAPRTCLLPANFETAPPTRQGSQCKSKKSP